MPIEQWKFLHRKYILKKKYSSHRSKLYKLCSGGPFFKGLFLIMMFPKGYYRLSEATKHFNFSQGRLDPEKVAPEIDPCHLAQGLGDFRYNSKCCLSIKVGKEWKYSSFIPKNCPSTNLLYSSFLLPSFFLLDPSPIIGYACQWLTDWLTHSLTAV